MRTAPSFDQLILLPAEEWTEAQPFPKGPTKHSFVSGDPQSQAIRVRYFRNLKDGSFAGRAWFGPQTEGPPGHAHGGSQAALLDEGMGAVAWLSGHTVLAAKIEINFRQPLPLETTLTVRSRIEKIEGRKIYVRGELQADDGRVFSEGSGLFIVIDAAEFVQRQKK